MIHRLIYLDYSNKKYATLLKEQLGLELNSN